LSSNRHFFNGLKMPNLVHKLSKYRKGLIYAGLTAIFCSLFLLSSKPPDDYCGRYIDLGNNLGFPLNCDSYNYVETAQDPAKLFEKESIRQSRPVYVIIAFAVGQAISPIVSQLPAWPAADQDELLTSPFYWGFMLLNFLFLWLSLLLFDRIIDILTDHKFPQIPKYLLAVYLISNIVIKTSFWSAHQQMLTIFSPLLCIFLTLNIILAEDLNFKKLCFISFVGGILLLTYGNFLILLPALLLAVTIQLYISGKLRQRGSIKFFPAIPIFFILPIAVWFSVLLLINGSVYSHEVRAYRQFVWVFDKLSISFKDFYEQFIHFATLYGISIYGTVLIFLVGLLFLKIYNWLVRLKEKKSDYPANYRLSRNWILTLFVFYFAFFFFIGYYSERLTFTLVPVVLCLIVLELNILLDRARTLTVTVIYVLLLLLSLGWVYRGVTYPEPYRELSKKTSVELLQKVI